jgi:putative two-component system response regulator
MREPSTINELAELTPLILVVDDNEMNRDLLRRRLEQQHLRVMTAEDGQQAINMIGEQNFDMVLLDIMMPGLNGYEVLDYIKGQANLRHIPVIMISALDEMDSIIRCIEAGADDYLPKPFNPVLLKARVNAGLDKKRWHDQELAYRQELQYQNQHLEERVGAQVKQIAAAELATIFALSKLSESKDPDTGAHLERMREYCKVLAQQLSLHPRFQNIINSEFITSIYAASPLHDIGKVGIPDHILMKPGKLTSEEWEVMKLHPLIGADTLRAVLKQFPNNPILQTGVEIAEGHHERWDGSGYPHQLKGEDIPISARILALADVYDALTSQRCYKEAFDHAHCRQLIIEGRESHFDPLIVDAYLAVEEEFVRIRLEFQDE